MKLSIFLITLVAVTVIQVKGDDIFSDILELDQSCRQESGITKEEFQELFNYNVSPSAKCYLKCVMSQFGVWNNGLDVNGVMAKVKKVPILGFISGKLKTMLNECKDVGGNNECEQAFNVAICLAGSVYKNYGEMIEKIFKAFKN